MSSTKEIEHLERIAVRFMWYARGCNVRTIEHSFHIFKRHIRGESILELGPAEGIMTNLLAPLARRFTIVDGSLKFCEDLRATFSKGKSRTNPSLKIITLPSASITSFLAMCWSMLPTLSKFSAWPKPG